MNESPELGHAGHRGAMLMTSAAIAVMIGLLVLASCQPSTLVSSLEGVVAAAEVAVPVIGAAAGIPAPALAAIVTYLRLVDAAAGQASTILAGAGTAAEKSAQIVAVFSNITAGCNCIPAGTPAAVVSVINAVTGAVASFISHFASKGILAAQTVEVKVTPRDRVALSKIRLRAEENTAKLKDVK